MTGMLFYAHSGVRYLVLLVGFAAIGWLLLAVVQKRPYDKTSKALMGAFTGLLDLQILLGLLTLMAIPFYGQLIGHLFLMFAAAIAGHGFVIVNRGRPEGEQSNAFLLLGAVLTMALIVLGILAIGRPIFGMSA